VPAGAALIEEGTDPGRLYVLKSGSVTIERDGVSFARIDSPGAVFGEMAVVLRKPATATVRAETDVEVHVAEDAEGFLTVNPGAALAVLRTTASRLDGLTQYLVDVKGQFAELEGHLGMVEGILDTLVNHQAPEIRTGSARDPEGDHVH
jgi:CRP-like cAMP-binding protein